MKEIFDWLREQMKKAEYNHTYYGTDLAVNTDKAIDIIDEAEAKWKEKEAELRANVIDEFEEALKKICAERPLGTDREKWIPLYVHEDGTWHSLIDDVVAQMKGA